MIALEKSGEYLTGTLRMEDADLAIGVLLREKWKLPKKTVHLLFQHKEVLLDGKPAVQHQLTCAGQTIMLRLCPEEPYGVEPLRADLAVYYEDDHLLIVDKPAGLLLHPTEPGHRESLDHLVAGHFQAQQLQTQVRHIHRLDQDTSGLVLYAKHGYAAALLDEQLRQRLIKRSYVAFVHGRVEQQAGTIKAAIGKDRHHPTRRRVSPGGEPAITHYEVLARYPQATKILCQLDTGRTHQVRVHLAHLGHPLVGDQLYGGKSLGIHRQALHAAKLELTHPFGGERIEVHSKLPQELLALEAQLQR